MALRTGDVIRGGLALAALVLIAALLAGRGERDLTGVARAVDGDTLVIEGERLRLKGLDAPELHQECRKPALGGGEQAWPCGAAAKGALQRVLAHGLTTCVGRERDRYGRLLVTCRVRGEDVNAALVRDGWAVSYGGYRAEEAEARDDGRGIWQGPFEPPAEWRKAHPRSDG